MLCLCISPVFSGEHDGHNHHDHDGHDHHKEKIQSATMPHRKGLRVEMIESRVVDGQDVIAVPIDAIDFENGKSYVFAQNEKDNTKFDCYEFRLRRSDGDYTEAISGVFPGDTVAIKKQQESVRQDRKEQRIRTNP